MTWNNNDYCIPKEIEEHKVWLILTNEIQEFDKLACNYRDERKKGNLPYWIELGELAKISWYPESWINSASFFGVEWALRQQIVPHVKKAAMVAIIQKEIRNFTVKRDLNYFVHILCEKYSPDIMNQYDISEFFRKGK